MWVGVQDSERDYRVVYKFEPFVLHVQCRSIEAAQELLQIALDCGFRESGLCLGRRKIMCAIRTTAHSLEVPLMDTDAAAKQSPGIVGLLVNQEYLKYLVVLGMEKHKINLAKHTKLEKALKSHFLLQNERPSDSGSCAAKYNLLEQSTITTENKVENSETLLLRWGHSAVKVGRKVLLFGGFGCQVGRSCHQRLNDLVVVDFVEDSSGVKFKIIESFSPSTDPGLYAPCPRVSHSACSLNCTTSSKDGILLLFGGRTSPSCPLNDFFICNIDDVRNEAALNDAHQRKQDRVRYFSPSIYVSEDRTSTEIEPRWGHSGAEVLRLIDDVPSSKSSTRVETDYCVIFGGRSLNKIFSDVHLVSVFGEAPNFHAMITKPTIAGKGPSKRFNHSACLVDNQVFIHGGYQNLNIENQDEEYSTFGILGDVFILSGKSSQSSSSSMSRLSWTRLDYAISFPRYSHQCVAIGSNQVFVLGGISPETESTTFAISFDIVSETVKLVPVVSQKEQIMLARFSLVNFSILQPDVGLNKKTHVLLAIGGGALCFSFGFCFNKTSSYSLCYKKYTSPAEDEPKVVFVHDRDKALVKRLKGILEEAQVYDKTRRICSKSCWFEIPVYPGLFTLLRKCYNDAKMLSTSTARYDYFVFQSNSSNPGLFWFLKCGFLRLSKHLQNINNLSQNMPPTRGISESREGSSLSKLQLQLKPLLEEFVLVLNVQQKWRVDDLLKDIPTRIEKLDNVLLLNPKAFSKYPDFWAELLKSEKAVGKILLLRNQFFNVFCERYRATTVVQVHEIASTRTRDSRAVLLYTQESKQSQPRTSRVEGHSDMAVEVEVKQNEVIYTLDLLKLMFSKGNISEKIRVSKFDCDGEIVVDLFAGIGYFSLQYLKHTKLKKILMCEVNPEAVKYLRRNLNLNKIDPDRYEILFGDNQVTIPKLCESRIVAADRVNLGLIPSSLDALQLVLTVINKTSGEFVMCIRILTSRSVNLRMVSVARRTRELSLAPKSQICSRHSAKLTPSSLR